MASLSSELRRKLEKAVVEARKVAELGARQALESLTVHEAKRGDHVKTEEQIQLRNRLRAHGRFLGDRRDASGVQSIDRLVEECAYQHWHRILFARFLAENDCLWHPDLKALVSLEEVEELAHEEGTHQWELAGRFAQAALPAIFPADNPVLEVKLPPEVLSTLIELVEEPASEQSNTGLAREVFRTDDSLGWVYQFWQNDANERANKSEEKINAATLPAVTQFFTEDYMVMSLLHNTLGAWHAGKVLAENPELAKTANDEDELRRAVALTEAGGYEFEYLRFVRESQETDGESEDGDGPWRPMGGTLEGWPRAAAELKVLDPCCGSGHFLVAAFELLARLRMREESLGLSAAIDAVLEDNLFGLELDKRCVQIAVFNVALSAWKMDSYRELPSMTIAHVGQSIGATREQWMKLLKKEPTAESSSAERKTLPAEAQEGLGFFWGQLYEMFSQASTLGSLINPKRSLDSFLLSDEQTAFLYGLLATAVAADPNTEPESHELGLAAKGLAVAVSLLSENYTLVATNVPYLGRAKQDVPLQEHSDAFFKIGRADLSTTCVLRVIDLLERGGTGCLVTPQNWFFLKTYRRLREHLIKTVELNAIITLGSNAFRDMNWWAATTGLITFTRAQPSETSHFAGMDTGGVKPPNGKAALLRGSHDIAEVSDEIAEDGFSLTSDSKTSLISQTGIGANPDSRFVIAKQSKFRLLRHTAEAYHGLTTGDSLRMQLKFWEFDSKSPEWDWFMGSCDSTMLYGGRSNVLRWCNGEGAIDELLGARKDGREAWGRNGVLVRQMRHLPATLYTGEPFDNNTATLVPEDESHLAAVWAFASSREYHEAVRKIDQKVSVTSATLALVPFDIDHWSKKASADFPLGLPAPESDDPTQWLFHGWPSESTSPLQVAVARLLGYRWPAELDSEMRLSERARALVARCSELDSFIDDDGIVCVPSVRGEDAAADRLARLLSACDVTTNENLDDWLRNRFFKEHCETFSQRPFIWHIYDGRKQDGFHALVNYHKLAGPGGRKVLESLTYSYLGDWITRQKDEVKRELPAAEARLLAAEELFKRLEAILEGEPPYDLFVRWKPIHEQPIGFEPDINDGVRINIRPFMALDLPGVPKDAGVFRVKPKIKWTKDRGKEPERPIEEYPWFWSWDEKTTDFTGGDEFDGVRWNDCHYTNAFKQAARRAAATRPQHSNTRDK
ncbi:N-6 DNA Methylase [Novipirellula aureliae]|uniref:site-specific DNA-methyltransferase (adenine-specific) n=1 Tax=Novipirellula aureliae TaxID=2527966 RepID=A0A5C6DUQ8_9BACT|nr:DNA methyltransferase [Novipirellula aureliae]TWU39994.1 N-6 DNA Methylase [Novipirellula aureliae]